jgi:hypothetical protein
LRNEYFGVTVDGKAKIEKKWEENIGWTNECQIATKQNQVKFNIWYNYENFMILPSVSTWNACFQSQAKTAVKKTASTDLATQYLLKLSTG